MYVKFPNNSRQGAGIEAPDDYYRGRRRVLLIAERLAHAERDEAMADVARNAGYDYASGHPRLHPWTIRAIMRHREAERRYQRAVAALYGTRVVDPPPLRPAPEYATERSPF